MLSQAFFWGDSHHLKKNTYLRGQIAEGMGAIAPIFVLQPLDAGQMQDLGAQRAAMEGWYEG